MIGRVISLGALAAAVSTTAVAAAPGSSPNRGTNLVHIRSLEADGQPVPWRPAEVAWLRSSPERLTVWFGAPTNAQRWPKRLRYRLEGYDPKWRETPGEMYLGIRFLNRSDDQVALKTYRARGESAGWAGTLESSSLTHRRETLVAPPGATQFHVIVSSAGPPATMGILVVDDLVVSRLSPAGGPPTPLLRSPFHQGAEPVPAGHTPEGWVRDGVVPSMARIVQLGANPTSPALAILDEDGAGHAEWRSLKAAAAPISPGEPLLIEWNELYSTGSSGLAGADYRRLPPGQYTFRAAETTALGVPTGEETLLHLGVPFPLWQRAWFWGATAGLGALLSMAGGRYVTWRRMRREMLHLQQQRLLEQDRVRIAQNIHDDLGARVTQISLLSGMAHGNTSFPADARADFDRISRLARELVSALYETVWAVNPENDNLEALGNYLCQMVEPLCAQAQLRCRLHVQTLPSGVQVPSPARHHLIMAVKEAVHNVIKHAKASELCLRGAFADGVLTISVADDGRGFNPTAVGSSNGLNNLRRRLHELGGSCILETEPGRGTAVRLSLPIRTSA